MLRSAGILGVGSYLPPYVVTNEYFKEKCGISGRSIEKMTGIKERRFTIPGINMIDMTYAAGKAALENANVDPTEIDFVILSTITQERIYPSIACQVQNRLGIPTTAGAYDMSVGCAGFVFALLNAFQYVQTGFAKKVLVVGVDECSRNMVLENKKERKVNILFGDGAGAAIVGEVSEGFGLLSSTVGSDGSGSEYMSEDSNHRPSMDGEAIFQFASTYIPIIVNEVLLKANLTLDDLDYLVPHQANLRIIEKAVYNLDFPIEKVATHAVQYYGNTSSASVALALADEVTEGRIKDGDYVALAGFGSGLAWSAALIKWGK
ncbi:beta-ketoacyl-ACP synthase 3 (plasmid) [Cytobacillus firmus]|uniref:3-oxoacyl-ACP synthase III family protein n=1 Tax=Bacillaceae TaxID=186817 RepID=UPI001A8F09AB|nr:MULTISPECIES: beta-ketoacyl-ACP synthase 3 [Bacillaceae]MBN8202571.1 beta-ketoacyl-ACP synthase 3 [Bacillus sp. NTK034]